MKHVEEFSESFKQGFSPWNSSKESQEAMARKTVLVSLLKYAPKTVELATAVNSDERVLNMRKVVDGSHSFLSVDVEVPQKNTESKETVQDDAGEKKAAQTAAGATSADDGAGKSPSEDAPQREQSDTKSAASTPPA